MTEESGSAKPANPDIVLARVYDEIQRVRIITEGMTRVQAQNGQKPLPVFTTISKACRKLERATQRILERRVRSDAVGRWLLSVYGIGPVIAAGLLSQLDVHRASAPSGFWRFAGLDPTIEWGKGQKRPYNARLKVLCWKAGQSFMKFSGREECFYGRLYRERKQYEVERNERGENAEAARQVLATRRIRDPETKAIYESGKLPAGQIDARARRWVVKLFLSHLFEVMWHVRRPGEKMPEPYVFEHMGHTHRIAPPNWPMEE